MGPEDLCSVRQPVSEGQTPHGPTRLRTRSRQSQGKRWHGQEEPREEGGLMGTSLRFVCFPTIGKVLMFVECALNAKHDRRLPWFSK